MHISREAYIERLRQWSDAAASHIRRMRPLMSGMLALAVLSVVAAAAPAGAESESDLPRAIVSVEPAPEREISTSSEGRDQFVVDAYMTDYGVDQDEAKRRLNSIDELQELVAQVVAIESDRLAGWGVLHEPQFTGWVYLVGSEAPSIKTQELARADELVVEVGAEHSHDELLKYVDSAASRTRLQSVSHAVVGSGIDMEQNAIRLYMDTSLLGLVDSDTSRQSIEVELRTNGTSPNYSVVRGEASVAYHNFYGGEAIQSDVLGNLCTSGFAVHRNGTRGFLTAGHCKDSATVFPETQFNESKFDDIDSSSNSSDIAPLRNHAMTAVADTMWYSIETSDTTTDDFYVTAGQRKDVNGKVPRSGQQGDFVCNFGSNTGRNCGTVTDSTFDPGACGPNFSLTDCGHSWVRVDGSAIDNCFGDSGGPVFVSRKAYGTITGGPATCTGWVAYMPIDHIENTLDVTLLTS